MRLYCKTLMQGDQWRRGVVLDLAQDGIIKSIEHALPQSADVVINGIVVPGMPNAHSHSFQRLIAGLTGPRGRQTDSFWSWRDAMYRTANRITPDQFGAVAQWVFIEMLKAGYTSCAEFHYVHHQPGGAAYADPAEMSMHLFTAASVSGIALTLLPVLYCTSGFGKHGVSEEQKRFANTPDQYLRLLEICKSAIRDKPRIELGMAPHSLRAVPASVLHEVLQCWQDRQSPVHIHIAEQPAEIEACLKHLGARPVEFLLDQFAVDQRWCLVHATHMSQAELRRAAESKATAGLCPTTEADLGDGVFRTAEWLKAGGGFAIGSDSNIRISVTEELRTLEYNERLGSGRRNVLTTAGSNCGRFLYQHAAEAGATALGQSIGRLQPGFRADFLELDDNHEMLAGRDPDQALDSWIFAGDGAMLNSVWVAGRRLVERGQHVAETQGRAAFKQAVADTLSA
ncbi:MAG: formimidoylglutamate deiminase [Lysobacterales bacterium]